MLNKLTEIDKNLAPMAYKEIVGLLERAQTNLISFKDRWYSMEGDRLFVVGRSEEPFKNTWDDYDFYW